MSLNMQDTIEPDTSALPLEPSLDTHIPLLLETPASSDNLTLALKVAKGAATLAGDFLQKKQGSVQVVHKKAMRDDLLDVDLEAEKIIINILRTHFPGYDILSEETEVENSGSNYRWIIDPLDGSTNFQHGNPSFGISISLLINDVTTVGVIYLPRLNEMFTAILGQGACLNDHRIHVSPTANLNDAIIHVGDFAKDGNTGDNKKQIHDMAHLADAVGRVRMIGTAAADLAYVACGRADALVVHNALPWDIEVGRLLMIEAGGEFSRFENEPGKSLTICSNSCIHQSLIAVINEEVSPEIGRKREVEVLV
jgi:myo-inositol-1(or 4)-monophosphatase